MRFNKPISVTNCKNKIKKNMMLKYDTGEHTAFNDVAIADDGSTSKCELESEMYSTFCYETPTMEAHRKTNYDAISTVERKSSAVPEAYGKNEEDSASSNILNVGLSTETNISETVSPVTHIEIIKSGSRRVTGANRVVPFLTSALKAGKQTVAETSLGQVYKTFLCDLSSNDNNKKCIICLEVFLSCTELEYHVRNVHVMDVSVNQCFVCRKKYIFQDQLQNHLIHIHSIHSPDLICKICFMEFGTTIEQKAHERKHDKSHVCSMCSEEFSTEYLYQKHLNQHSFQVKPNDCKKCGKRFKNMSSLQIHEKRHVDIMCIICGLLFGSDVSFLLHAKEHKNEDVMKLLKDVEGKDQEETRLEEILAVYQNLTLKSKINIQENHESNAQENSILECLTTMVSAVSQISDSGVASRKGMECKLCGVNVSTGKELLDHRKKFHLRNRTCPFCGKRNRSVSQTWRHMNSHLFKNKDKLPNNKKQVKSNLNCIKDRSEGTNVVKNKQALKHPHLYSCNICSRKFLYPGSRDSHVLQHSKDKCDSWKCTMCEQMFSHPGLLLTHISVHEQTIKCHICDKPFLSERALQLHIKTHFVEEEKKMFKCNICSVECPLLAGFQAHLRCHTGERPYVCGQCNGKFKRRQALKKHIQVVHNSASLQYHSCLECQRIFNSSGNLIRHYVRIHCQVRRFICGLCGSRFSQNQDFRRHFKVFHKVEMPNINGSDRKALREIYVIPDIDDLSEADPHAVKIRAIVAEEKAKFSRLSELLAAKNLNEENTYDKSVMQFIGDLSKEKFQQTVAVLQSSAEKDYMVEAEESEKETSSGYLEKVLHVEQNSTRKMYLTHSNVSERDKLYSCEHCKKTFSEENEYLEHVAEESKSYSCRQCGNNFCDQVLLDNHFVSVHGFVQHSISLNDLNHKENYFKNIQNIGQCHEMQHLSNVPQDAKQETTDTEQDSADMKQISQEEIAILSNSIKDVSVFSSIDGIGNAIPTLPLCDNVKDADSNSIPTTFNFNGFIVQNVIIQQNSTVLPPVPVSLQNQEILNASALTPVVTLNSNISVNHHTSALYNINDVQNIAIVKGESSSNILSISERVNHQNLEGNFTNDMNTREISDKCREILNNGGSLEQEDLDRLVSFNENCKRTDSPDNHKKVSCNNCGEKFCNAASLKRHMKCHAETKSANTKPFGCPDCGKHFSEKHNLKVHLMTHTGERPYKCEDCGKQFRYRNDIIDHKRMHLGEKPFACNECDRKFIRRRELIRHQLIHTGEKKHKCPICGKTFGRLDQLRHAHLPTHATGNSQPKHTCNICNKSFRLKSKLKQHEFLHSGLKKYKCELCKKCFALEMYLKTHMQCHKKRDTYLQCPKCPRRFISEATLKVHEDSFHARLKKTRKHEKVVEGNYACGEDSAIHFGNFENGREFGTANVINDINLDALETNNCNTVIYLQMTPDDLKFSLH